MHQLFSHFPLLASPLDPVENLLEIFGLPIRSPVDPSTGAPPPVRRAGPAPIVDLLGHGHGLATAHLLPDAWQAARRLPPVPLVPALGVLQVDHHLLKMVVGVPTAVAGTVEWDSRGLKWSQSCFHPW